MTASPARTRSFDISGPLPSGITVLEASAGTGKTYTIGALVARYVAEGALPLRELLVVTFGRAASQELRDRVRRQLVACVQALSDPASARRSGDSLIVHLAGASDEEVEARRARLITALTDFDAATIATTHQFCQQVLAGLGVAGDSDPDAELTDNLDELVSEVVDDIYLRAYGVASAGEPEFSRTVALKVGRAAVFDPGSRLEPLDADPGSPADLLRRFATAVRAEVDRRKRRRGLLGYDDLLARLADTLTPENAAARDRMRHRWSVVLIDEFQDTDPVQWEVFRRAFAGHAAMVLIGDPKQAIYAFRGGDVVTYLTAAATAERRFTLDQNWRSDGPLAAALESLFDGAALGDPGIVVRPVTAVRSEPRLTGVPRPAPVRLRVVTREHLGRTKGYPAISELRDYVATDLAADIAQLLAADRAAFDGRRLSAGDIAVLVGTHGQAAAVREKLTAQGIPTVVASAGSVYAGPAGRDWLTLLRALEQPHRGDLVRAAALTPFLGYTPAELGLRREGLTDEVSGVVREWADLVNERGVAVLMELATVAGLWTRLLGEPDGERRLTDTRHVGEGLPAAALEDGLGLAALVDWLAAHQDESTDRSDERSRRLDSDAEAVQILTLHASKGLEYPVVYLPFAFDRFVGTPDILLLHDESGARVLDVGGQRPGRAKRAASAAAEDAGEALRLLYVGLTRARSQVVLWWAASSRNTAGSGLHRLLFGRNPASNEIPDSVKLPTEDEVSARLTQLQAAGALTWEHAVPADTARPVFWTPAENVLSVGVFDRTVDTAWRRVSYSSLTAGVPHESGVSSEAETPQRDDEAPAFPMSPGTEPLPGTEFFQTDDDAESVAKELLSPMAELPGGTSTGTLVHAVLEDLDPAAGELAVSLGERATELLSRFQLPVTAEQMTRALLPALRTPLGPLAGNLCWADIPASDRLAELTFEFPLAGGDHPVVDLALDELIPLLRRHIPPGDPLAEYPGRLAAANIGRTGLRGYLTGSIDAVLRLPGPRYVVVDYKTNRLGAGQDVLTAADYRPAALARAMMSSHYPLQALLYSVALHRFLRWRQPGYDAGRHLGGSLYLFLRGMCGPKTPILDGAPCGVFGWQPPAALVIELSALLDRGAAPAPEVASRRSRRKSP